jgi:uncharacterized protein (TIGR02246 family)
MTSTDRAAADEIAARLQAAWNAADGSAFARAFTEDADFVNIFAMHVTGREAIAKAHDFIFSGIYRGSTSTFSVEKVRALGADVLLAHIKTELDVPEGAMAGELRALATAVLVREGSGWSIAAFHNTREARPPGM